MTDYIIGLWWPAEQRTAQRLTDRRPVRVDPLASGSQRVTAPDCMAARRATGRPAEEPVAHSGPGRQRGRPQRGCRSRGGAPRHAPRQDGRLLLPGRDRRVGRAAPAPAVSEPLRGRHGGAGHGHRHGTGLRVRGRVRGARRDHRGLRGRPHLRTGHVHVRPSRDTSDSGVSTRSPLNPENGLTSWVHTARTP